MHLMGAFQFAVIFVLHFLRFMVQLVPEAYTSVVRSLLVKGSPGNSLWELQFQVVSEPLDLARGLHLVWPLLESFHIHVLRQLAFASRF